MPEVVPEVPLLDDEPDELDDEELLLLEDPLDDPLEEPLDDPLDDDELPVDELPVDDVMMPDVPPDDELELDEEELDDELDELDDDELALLPELEVTLPDDEVTLPDDEVTLPELEVTLPDDEVTLPEVVDVVLVTPPVEVLTPPVEVLTPPVEVVLVIPPVEVETPPVVVDVDEPPLPPELVEVDEPVVELSISISILMPEVLPVVPLLLDEPEVDVLVVVDRLTLPPPLLLPPKKPPKKPLEPPPKPPEPPMTIGWPPPPPLTRWPCGMGRGNAGSGRAATSTSGSTSITRRMRRVSRLGRRRSTTRRALWRSFTSTSPPDLYDVVAVCGSATWTAPPASKAVPAAAADNFARANLIDMPGLSSHFPVSRLGPMLAFTVLPSLQRACDRPLGQCGKGFGRGQIVVLCQANRAAGALCPTMEPNGVDCPRNVNARLDPQRSFAGIE